MSAKKKTTKKAAKKVAKKPAKKKALAGDKMAAAKALIQEAEQKSTQECWLEVEKVLKKHGCTLVAQPIFLDGGNGAFVVSTQAGIGVVKEE